MYSAIKQITSLKYKYKYKDLKYIDLFTVYSLQFFLTISVAHFLASKERGMLLFG